MCGIVGQMDWERDLTLQKDVLIGMTQTLIPRGPDAEGYWLTPRAAFGHRRLVVVDPKGGLQPMIRRRGEHTFTLIYNGELYNTPELRQELLSRGYIFEGHSDTEAVLLSYLEWGPSCVERFNGIFAFGIWDSQEQQLFVARDRLGVKPLFYSELLKGLVFASELKALLKHPAISPNLGTEGLSEIFLLGPARTPGVGVYEGISELRPGHFLIYSANGLRIRRYWALPNHVHEDDLPTTIAKIRELFVDTVQRQLVSDVPIGTLLSGGLDSSAITAIAAEFQNLNGHGSLPTFSVDYAENDKYFQANEFQPSADGPWIERVSQTFGTKHTNCAFKIPELVQALKASTIARDLPGMADVDSSLLLFSREIKKKVTVGLSGECADEVFGGYPWFHRQDALDAQTFPWTLHVENRLQILSPELHELLHPRDYLLKRYEEALSEIPLLPSSSSVIHQDSRTLTGNLQREARIREITYLTLTRFMPTLLDRKDRMTMATGLEVRVPYCDHRLVEYAWNIPWEMKAIEGREKGLLRQALTGILPDDVLWRRKSPYPKTHHPSYLSTVRTWLRDILADKTSPVLPFINVPALRDLMKLSDTMPSGRPWFGQLMDIPQLFAYLIQVNYWLVENKVRIL
ncbi:asparagine synthase (glutamine-hydrolyzing) [Desulfosporosinus sp. BICA1-9]|uniref:asparagine synthase (glutamine-hydrolyzing) n=1 Tax=Desulfosporosinus sp. BICA1-9 TaxID=1531958 RepID=UPI00054B687D|nr:asparagine synthase (glutamine-hydrolyzing) [Desulfosporosinus sp. BICA1-9]KJS48828.1 MAG: asparagine synthase [Peptococcaceae bacterium BRH_c23]KJS87082.1 MAG: asparagine synthase [Desulfosporosinus sp. BICA1-9]HBW34170.1 asparagine synthase (glutamine-hydrolyzing) [Desulfosporosinus sp.]